MLINHFLENSARSCPEKQAIWHLNNSLTYAEIDNRANKLANYLKEVKVRAGDRVAILYENSFDCVISYFAVLKIGAIAVLLNTDTTIETVAYCLNDSGAMAIITNQKYCRYLAPVLKQCPLLKEIIADQEDMQVYTEIKYCRAVRLHDVYAQGCDVSIQTCVTDQEPALIVYTSGSTGQAKGVLLSHLNIVSNTHSIVRYLKLTHEDRMMAVLPFYYIYGLSLLNTHFSVGGSLVLENRFAFPQVVLETMKKMEVTGFAGVPSTFLILLRKSAVKKFRFESLRYVTQAGGAMAEAVQKEVAQVFDPAKLFIMYGATEASPRLSYVEPEMLSKKWGSVGRAVPDVDIQVVDGKGNKLPAGQTGEIIASGPNIMMGYWKDPAGTAEVLKNGYYHTGDLGSVDQDGYLYITGRIRDTIKAGGFRVSAQEIEDALLTIEFIDEAAVIGVDDPVLGEAVKAFIVIRKDKDFSEADIRKSLQQILPPYKLPKYITAIDSLPKNKVGKVAKEKLRIIS